METRDETKHVYTVPEGATFRFLGLSWPDDPIGIVAHPDWPPRYVMLDGTERDVLPPPTKTE